MPQQDTWKVLSHKKLLTTRLEAHYEADRGEKLRLQSLINWLVIFFLKFFIKNIAF